jgi:hypothetical protein
VPAKPSIGKSESIRNKAIIASDVWYQNSYQFSHQQYNSGISGLSKKIYEIASYDWNYVK